MIVAPSSPACGPPHKKEALAMASSCNEFGRRTGLRERGAGQGTRVAGSWKDHPEDPVQGPLMRKAPKAPSRTGSKGQERNHPPEPLPFVPATPSAELTRCCGARQRSPG